MPKPNFSKVKKEKDNIINLKESPFNSKLFFELNIGSNDIDNEFDTDSNDSKEIEFKNDNNNYFLSNELIEEINSSFYEQKEKSKSQKTNNNKNEYENYQLNKNNSKFNNNFYSYCFYRPYNPNPFTLSMNKYFNLFKEVGIKGDNSLNRSKGDWICFFCNNLNYSFRNRCNRCKRPK